jgi:penicillin amidase
MKIFKWIFIVFVFLIIIAGISGLIFVNNLAHKGIPHYTQDIQLVRIKEPVTVYRDSFAIPHIYAQNKEDLYLTVGYVMAQDRLWQMDLIRRATAGRLSEIFGEDYVDTDLFLRALRIPEKSRMVLDSTNRELIISLEAFCDGVNQFIEQHTNKLPFEFSLLGYNPEKWEPEHSLHIIGYMAWDLAGGAYSSEITINKLLNKFGEKKLKDLIPNIAEMKSVVYPDFKMDSVLIGLQSEILNILLPLKELGLEVFHASNNWAVSGEKSSTGMPIMANDMHLGLNAPGIWYQIHQVIEGELNVTGLAIPGEPAIVAGHNENIAWGMTNIYVDDLDLYFEKTNPDNQDEYWFNNEWQRMEVRREKIRIKGDKVIEKELRFTHRGPIISEFKEISQAISMRWIGNDYSNEMRSVFLLNEAGNWEDFKDAIKTFNAVSQNFVYADVKGNIGLYAGGGIPIRKGNGFTIMPGETDEFDWTGRVPFDQLPNSYNPSCGFVASANNKTVDNDYPYYIGSYFVQSYRINRIRELLSGKEKLTIKDFQEIQLDQKSKLAEKLMDDFTDAIEQSEDLTSLESEVLQILLKWNFEMSDNSPAPTIFENLYLNLAKNILYDEMGDELFNEYFGNSTLVINFIENLWRKKDMDWCDDVTTRNFREKLKDMILKSYKETVSSLKAQLGKKPGNWQWSEVHQFSVKHPMSGVKIINRLFKLTRGPYDVGGSFHTVSPYTYPFSNPFVVDHGASQRHIFSTANWDESLTIIPTGECGVPASDFYCDQTDLYIQGKYHSDYFSKKLVEKNARYKIMITAK